MIKEESDKITLSVASLSIPIERQRDPTLLFVRLPEPELERRLPTVEIVTTCTTTWDVIVQNPDSGFDHTSNLGTVRPGLGSR